METITATLTSRIYGTIVANPGATMRGVNKILGTAKTGGAFQSLVKRGAIIAVAGETERSTRYYKGAAPVKLNQAHGLTQIQLNRDLTASNAKKELVRDIRLLMAQLESLV